MISDVLSDAVDSIEKYLEMCPDVYSGKTRDWVQNVVKQMNELREHLDAPPPVRHKRH